MTLDRGGLRYPIEALDKYSTAFQGFIASIRSSREELAKLQRSARRGVDIGSLSTGIAQSRREATSLSKEMSKVARETGLVGKSLKEEVTARKQIARDASKVRVEIRRARIESQEEFQAVRKTLGETRARARAEKEVTRTIDRRKVAEQRAVVARDRAQQLSEGERRRLQAVSDLEKERVQAVERLERSQRRRSDAAIRALRVEEAIQQRILRDAEKSAVNQGLLNVGRGDLVPRSRTSPIVTPQDISTVEKGRRSLRDFLTTLAATDAQSQKTQSNIGRLFGAFAAVFVVRRVIRTFAEAVSSLVRVNAEIEQAELSIAALFTAVGEIRDPFGETADSARALVLSQKEARRQTNLLRQDALRTTATFRTLLDTFQVAIAPGLTSGLDLDQIREFTVQISQAAQAIGLQQNQLSEEIRSILQGTIQVRTTRIAVALGITNEDIRNAREAGVLAEFLEERFVAFNEAGKASFNTFNGLVSRIQDGFELLLNTGGVEFFDEVKAAALDLFQVLTDTDDITGAITPAPGAVQVVQQISAGLSQALRAARGIRESLRLEDVVRASRQFGQALASAGRIFVGLIEGAVQGVSDLEGAAEAILGTVKEIFGVSDLEGIQETARVVARIGTVLIAIQIGVGIINSLLAITVAAVTLLIAPLTLVTSLSAAIAVLWSPATLIVAAVALALIGLVAILATAVKITQSLLSRFAGVELRLITIGLLVSTTLVSGLREAVLQAARLRSALVVGVLSAITTVGTTIERFLQPLIPIVQALENVRLIPAGTASALSSINSSLLSSLQERLTLEGKIGDALDDQLKSLRQARDFRINDILQVNDTLGFGDALLSPLRGIGDQLRETLFGDLFNLSAPAEEVAEQAKTLVDEFDLLQPSAGRAVTTLETLSGLVKRLKDDIEASRDDLDALGITLGLDSPGAEILNTAFRAQVQLREDAREIDDEILKSRREQEIAAERAAAIEGRILTLRGQGRDFVEATTAGFDNLAQAQSRVFEIEKQRSIARAALARAVESGFDDNISQTTANLNAVERELEAALEVERAIKAELVEITNQARLYGIDIEEIGRLVRERIELAGDERALAENLNLLLAERAKLEEQISTSTGNRIAAQAQAAAFELQQENQRAAFDVARQQLELQLRFASEQEKALTRTQLEVDIAREELRIKEERAQLNLDALTTQRAAISLRVQELQAAVGLAEGEEDRLRAQEALNAQKRAGVALDNLIAQTQQEVNIELESARILLEQQRIEAERIRAGLEAPLSTGFIDGLRNFSQEAGLLFENIASTVTTALQDVAQLGASTIAGLFDPSQNVSLGQSIGRFLQGIGQQILQVLISTLLARLISVFVAEQAFEQTKFVNNVLLTTLWTQVGVQWQTVANSLLVAGALLAGSGGGIGFSKGGAIGMAEGGPTPRGRAAPRAPKGLHPSDRIPIWAAAGEFMVRARSAMMYGHDTLDKINKGLVDPYALRALVGVGHIRKQVSAVPKLGYESGGPIAAITSRTTGSSSIARESQPMPAYIVANEQAAERLLSGGRSAFIRFLDEAGYRRD
jgi:hypothetical protein